MKQLTNKQSGQRNTDTAGALAELVNQPPKKAGQACALRPPMQQARKQRKGQRQTNGQESWRQRPPHTPEPQPSEHRTSQQHRQRHTFIAAPTRGTDTLQKNPMMPRPPINPKRRWLHFRAALNQSKETAVAGKQRTKQCIAWNNSTSTPTQEGLYAATTPQEPTQQGMQPTQRPER
jgi:hypothetical protein